ncbi:MAG TPA: DUF480 domain-containing protein [Bryobacteraceae bacterium]|nr:DUF480 domain-containing protein [Bryobacteraceae bacterium]
MNPFHTAPLHAVEVRVLGSLLEKESTTPEYYPLTVNALVNACNQKSSRDPIVQYDDATVEAALDTLRQKGLVLKISGAGHRVEKYAHRLGETLNLGRRELALLCVLMLRGAQTVGELRGRTERMHAFEDLDEVERLLEHLATREPEPLVARAARGRWAHLLSGEFVEDAAPETAAIPALPPRPDLEARMEALEHEVEQLKQQWESFRRQFE